MDANTTRAAELSTQAASERLVVAAARLLQHTNRSSSGEGPASDGYLDSIEAVLKSTKEYAHALTHLRDVLRARLGRS